MSKQIFISYRREDAADVTGRIYDRLVRKFDKTAVFKDVDSIPPGMDFRKHLESVINECAVVLVVIGDGWLAKDAGTGVARLDNPHDFVRIEIESALRRGIPVIPLLVEGAPMPSEESLPEGPLRELAYRHGIEIGRDPNFHPHMDRLIEGLEEIFARGSRDDGRQVVPPQASQAQPHASPVGPSHAVGAGTQSVSGRRRWLWVLGGAAAFVILAFVSVVFLIIFSLSGTDTSSRQDVDVSQAPAPAAETQTAAAAETLTYASRNSEFHGVLKQRFVDFSFDCPASWQFDPNAGKEGSLYFVMAGRNAGSGADIRVLENFGVSWYISTGTLAGDRPYFPQVVEWLGSEYKKYFASYQKVSEGETRIGPYSGYEVRFKYSVAGTPQGDATVWGRIVLLPNPAQHNGVALIMLASSYAPEFKGTNDVGIKGETPLILNSFRLGR